MFGKKKAHHEVLRTKIHTLVGEETTVEGNINFKGGLHVVGTVKGDIHSEDDASLLIINENALVVGDIRVNHLIVNGQIDGNVYVEGKVELFDKALINGDVHYTLLELPVGAEVNGKLVREEKNVSNENEEA